MTQACQVSHETTFQFVRRGRTRTIMDGGELDIKLFYCTHWQKHDDFVLQVKITFIFVVTAFFSARLF